MMQQDEGKEDRLVWPTELIRSWVQSLDGTNARHHFAQILRQPKLYELTSHADKEVDMMIHFGLTE